MDAITYVTKARDEARTEELESNISLASERVFTAQAVSDRAILFCSRTSTRESDGKSIGHIVTLTG